MKKRSSVQVGNDSEKLVKEYYESLGALVFCPAKRRFQKDKDIFDVGDLLVMYLDDVFLVQVKTNRVPCAKERKKYESYNLVHEKVLRLIICVVHQDGKLLEFMLPDLKKRYIIKLVQFEV